MVIGIIGECCTGKSTLADMLKEKINCEIYTGKDYLRLAKNESIARRLFQKMLIDSVDGDNIIYVISEQEQLSLLPDRAIRVLVSADIEIIKERFARRMNGNLPAPVASMLERMHGCFDRVPHDVLVISGETDLESACAELQSRLCV